MAALLLTLLVLALLPVLVLAAVAARMLYDDWGNRKDARRQTKLAERRGAQVGQRMLTLLQGGASNVPSDGERPNKTA